MFRLHHPILIYNFLASSNYLLTYIKIWVHGAFRRVYSSNLLGGRMSHLLWDGLLWHWIWERVLRCCGVIKFSTSLFLDLLSLVGTLGQGSFSDYQIRRWAMSFICFLSMHVLLYSSQDFKEVHQCSLFQWEEEKIHLHFTFHSGYSDRMVQVIHFQSHYIKSTHIWSWGFLFSLFNAN